MTATQNGDTMTKDNGHKKYKLQLVWKNIALIVGLHVMAVYGYYLFLTQAKSQTLLFFLFTYVTSAWGLQIGTHRLWSHRSYKAKMPLELLLAFFQTMGFQASIYQWCWDHRTHHMYADTDADPHNSKRGFFFSHIGWFMCKRHPESVAKGKMVDMSDLKANPIVRFQHKYYLPLALLIWATLPTVIPWYFWNEDPITAYMVCVAFRTMYVSNSIFLVNSAAHMWGYKPYDKNIAPVECKVRYMLFGEGYHNYHHAFPWDYSASELGPYDVYNPGTALIEFFAWLGWAYDLRRAPQTMIEARVKRSGDPTLKIKSSICDVLLGCLVVCLPFWLLWFRYVFVKLIQLFA